MPKLVSLTTVQVVITNPNYEQIIVGGNGSMMGSISLSRSNSAFAVTGYADGSYTTSYTKNRSGNISLSVSQGSSVINRLTRFINWCEANPNLAESTITVMDSLGVIQGYASGVYPEKLPDNIVSDSVQNRTFNFSAGVVTFEEGE